METYTIKDLVKKAKKEKKELLELLKESCQVQKHPSLLNKIKMENLLVQDYLDKQFRILSLSEKDSTKAEELRVSQEVNRLMGILNLYCLGVNFDLISEENDYNTIYDNGIYDYVRSFCAEDMDKFEASLDRSINVAMNNGAAIALTELMKSMTGNLDVKELEKVKDELRDMLTSETYKRVSAVADKLN